MECVDLQRFTFIDQVRTKPETCNLGVGTGESRVNSAVSQEDEF